MLTGTQKNADCDHHVKKHKHPTAVLNRQQQHSNPDTGAPCSAVPGKCGDQECIRYDR